MDAHQHRHQDHLTQGSEEEVVAEVDGVGLEDVGDVRAGEGAEESKDNGQGTPVPAGFISRGSCSGSIGVGTNPTLEFLYQETLQKKDEADFGPIECTAN